jgi:pyridoxal phosphate enzyme (YggS family)
MSTRQVEIANNLQRVRERIERACEKTRRSPDEITLIAVTKTYPASDVQILKDLGINEFGENRDDEGHQKSTIVLGTWHFQGQIQSKKLGSISSWAHVIHSIDQVSHLEKLERALSAKPIDKSLRVFLQLSLDGAQGRGGVVAEGLETLANKTLACPHLILMGLMCVPPVEQDADNAFAQVAQIHARFLTKFPDAKNLSMGMSGDFESAITHGATHIRVGSSILGSRR